MAFLPDNFPQNLDVKQQVTVLLGLVLFLAVLSRFKPDDLTLIKPKIALDATNWQKFKLVEKIVLSPNTAIYRFELPKNHILGLPIGQHVSVSATIEGKLIQRSYTPTSSDDDVGFFDLLIKSYPTGNISKHFGQLKVGDYVDVKGPKGQMRYAPGFAKDIGMIAGGTGITPMLQIIRAALKNPKDRTQLSLIYANVNPEDILLKTELDELASKHADRFKVYYVLNNPPAGWTGGSGFVTLDMVKEHLAPHSHDAKMLLCGPPPMMTAMKKHLDELKWPAPRTVSKMADSVFLF
ncbi:hypothetical protein JCM10207_004300 [Rhodosporidiobolus poonsookiae]